jgi:hypothetical protein
LICLKAIVEGPATLFRVGSRPSSPNPLAALAEPKIALTGVASRSSMKVWWVGFSTSDRGDAMSIGTILLIILVIALLGGFSGVGGGPFYGGGPYLGGVLGLVLVIVLILVVLGRI